MNFKTLQTFDSRSFFIGQSYFFTDGAQLYLILQTLYYTFKRLGDTDNSLSLSVSWYGDSFLLFI